MTTIAIIGYGEAGSNMAAGLRSGGIAVQTYDIKFGDPEAFARMSAHAAEHGVTLKADTAACVIGADAIFSFVDSAAMDDAAEASLPHLVQGQTYVDMNSAGPGAKQRIQSIIQGSAAEMVDGAVMADVPPTKHKTKILAAGPTAGRFAEFANAAGMNVEAVPGEAGAASATKMLRSVLMKGISSLILECALVAEKFGKTEEILVSVGDSIGMDLRGYADKAGPRQLQHAGRRVHEMDEVAITLREAGIDPLMSAACAEQLKRFVDAGANAGLAGKRPDDLAATVAILRAKGF
ncbi:MAG: DUF1932 domain-containing protein [Alphaproteobacteria bacterium]